MSLKLYLHPLASYCQKALIAFYENDTPFEPAKARMATSYGMIERDMATKPGGAQTWATGAAFTMADCAAAPALFYANLVVPFGDNHKNVAAYFGRLMKRPSFARAVEEAK